MAVIRRGVNAAMRNVTEDRLDECVLVYEMMQGRPTTFDEMIASEIIARITNGETLRNICQDKNMPSYVTVYRWMNADYGRSFCNAMSRARRGSAAMLVEEGKELLDLADDERMAQVQKADKQAQFRLTMAKCFDRETFGDKVQQDVNVRGVVIHTDNTELARLMNDDD